MTDSTPTPQPEDDFMRDAEQTIKDNAALYKDWRKHPTGDTSPVNRTPQAGDKVSKLVSLDERLVERFSIFNKPDPTGRYVLHSDYLTLQSQLEEIQNECLKQARLAETADYALQEALGRR